ncbi:MAG: helix-turn-helix domain-containing protein [Brevibacterium aurantiacum]|nr:helix-turn-helix domain-containing protein [Brevibacterium aurantiacum]MDN5738174.1 helix-turn-helix domain-containing protein [Brevibacterium aurantiacum]MDN5807077.1 helix-turn-helix domain-containing protein [Brevibacterium sp.]MDN6158456.1 helix-turn-helix domain-containing protein [Brevibacterium sp.]
MPEHFILPSDAPRDDDGTARGHVSRIARDLDPQSGQLTQEVHDYLAQHIHELGDDPSLIGLLHASVAGNIETIVDTLAHSISRDRIEPPTAAFEYARRLAQRGTSVNALVRAYRLGQQRILQYVYDTTVTDAELPSELIPDVFQMLVNDVSVYIDWMSEKVVDVYERERESWVEGRTTARDAQVRRILNGEIADTATAERHLGYALGGRHLAIIAWRDIDSPALGDQLRRFTAMITEFASIVGAHRPGLVIGRDEDTVWGWISLGSDWTWTPATSSDLPSDDSFRLAVGSAHIGTAGFRLSHQEAERVQRVSLASKSDRQMLCHDEPGMAVAALLTQDIDATRLWVRTVLGDLAEESETNHKHRRNLLIFLQHDLSFTATAAAMTMHKNSVRYRVGMAEAALGRAVSEDRFAVETALYAHHHLGGFQ